MRRPDGYLLPKVRLDPEDIIREVARGFRVTYEEILGPCRERRVAIARACAMATVRSATTLSFPSIGDLFNRDHTTVMHHVQKIMADPELAAGVKSVVEELLTSESESWGKPGHTVEGEGPGVREHPGRGRHPEEVPAMFDRSRGFRREEAV